MDSQKHEVVSSQLIYKFECLEIILSKFASLFSTTRSSFVSPAVTSKLRPVYVMMGRKSRHLNTVSSFRAKSDVSYLRSCPRRLILFSMYSQRK